MLTESNFKNLASQRCFFQEVKVITMIRTANKKLQQIQDGSSREWILIAPMFIPQVRISFVIKHFISCKVHAGMEYLQWLEITARLKAQSEKGKKMMKKNHIKSNNISSQYLLRQRLLQSKTVK
jgi:hypothetical protein